MSLLMLLALMTYGRLETFRSFAFVQAEFKTYMEKEERRYANDQAIKRYETSPASQQEKDEEKSQERNPASPKLSFNLFLDKDERASNAALMKPFTDLAKSLMTFLYGGQPFFQEMEQKRPGFLDEILQALIKLSDTFADKEKLHKIKEVATLDLGDPQLNEVFTKMLRGSTEVPEEIPLDEQDLTQEPSEQPIKPVWGYESLLDFITVQKNKLKIRVFLASPELLMAIYGDPSTVDDILATRYQLYRDLVNNVTDSKTSSEDFKSKFTNMQLPTIPADMLDFGVSKTNPRSYSTLP